MRTNSGQAATISDTKLNQFFKLLSIGNHPERNQAIIALSHYLALRAKEISCLRIHDILDAQGNILATSNPVKVQIQHHSLSRALLFFGLGAVVFLFTLVVVLRGQSPEVQQ